MDIKSEIQQTGDDEIGERVRRSKFGKEIERRLEIFMRYKAACLSEAEKHPWNTREADAIPSEPVADVDAIRSAAAMTPEQRAEIANRLMGFCLRSRYRRDIADLLAALDEREQQIAAARKEVEKLNRENTRLAEGWSTAVYRAEAAEAEIEFLKRWLPCEVCYETPTSSRHGSGGDHPYVPLKEEK